MLGSLNISLQYLTKEINMATIKVIIAGADHYCFFQCPVEGRVLEGVSLRGRFGDISVLETGEVIPVHRDHNDPTCRDSGGVEKAQDLAAQYLGL